MTDFTPTPEAVRLVESRLNAAMWKRWQQAEDAPTITDMADDAIAAFVEAEGLHIQTIEPEREIREWVGRGDIHAQRLVGPWRKRD